MSDTDTVREQTREAGRWQRDTEYDKGIKKLQNIEEEELKKEK